MLSADVTTLPSEYRDFVTFAHRPLLSRLARAAVALALLLAGCGGNGSGDSTTTSAPVAVPHLGIVLAAAPAGESGALVRSLLRNGVRSLLRPGDLIVVVNGTRAKSAAQVRALLTRQSLGDRLTLTVLRGSRRLTFAETLSPNAYLGAEVRSNGPAAVMRVAPGSPAARAGLAPGDTIVAIDGRPISGARAVLAALATRHAGDTVRIEVARGSRRLRLTAVLGERR